MSSTKPQSLPASNKPDFIPSAVTGWVGVVGFILGVVWLNQYGEVIKELNKANPNLHWAELYRYWEALIVMGFTAIPMMACDALLLRANAPEGPIDGMTKQHAYSIERTLIKLIGLSVTLGAVAFLYWVFPEYNPSMRPVTDTQPNPAFYSNFFTLCWRAGPYILGVCAVYFFFIDARMTDPHDGYWHFGRALMLDFARVDWAKVSNHLRTWTVKGFFLPLMFTYLCNNLPGMLWRGEQANGWHQFVNEHGQTAAQGFLVFHHYAHNFLFSIDLAFVACGYVLTLRWVQSHVRSAEPTALGWTAALICYQPFWTTVGDLYLGYWSDGNWESKLPNFNLGLFYLCGVGILIFETIFVWATISFGLRFSNLTHRGIVTGGPYYFTKHPAYISKICAFFLIALPWADGRGLGQGVRNLLMLAGLSFVYWVRGKTEERNLSSMDPAYSIYAEQIRQRHWRWLRFQFGKPPKTP